MDTSPVTNIAIYARVSTDSQDYDTQIDSCERFCEYKKFSIKKVYKDTGSGKNWKDRPEFSQLIQDLRKFQYDGIVVFRLDRLFRNVVEAVNFFQEWNSRGIEVYSINENLDTSTAIGRAMRDIILVLAQLERENISEATKARLQSMKDAGIKLGRPKISKYQMNKIVELRTRGKSIRQIARQMHLGKSTVAKYLKELDVPKTA